MPPRKAKAVGEDDQCPMLKLIMEKGPLSGQIFDFRPGSVISVGRVVRGNAISIKDAGISSKHMLIQVEAMADPSQRLWVVTDLDSSNGTFLNGELVEPSAALSDGDVIKIGEQTSIIVKFEANLVENEVGSKNVRRNARRGVKVQKNLGVIDELSELGLGNNEDEKKGEEVAEIGVEQVSNVSTRRTRNSKKNEIALNDLGLNEARESEGVSTRRTRNSRKGEEAPVTEIDLSVIEGNKRGKGGRGRKKLPAKTIPEETKKEEDGLNESVELLDTSKKDAELGSTSGVKESNVDNGKGKIEVDLDKMTFGQWFDFLEVYFPQKIIDETEVMFAEMRGTAKKFHEFMLEQKKASGEK